MPTVTKRWRAALCEIGLKMASGVEDLCDPLTEFEVLLTDSVDGLPGVALRPVIVNDRGFGFLACLVFGWGVLLNRSHKLFLCVLQRFGVAPRR